MPVASATDGGHRDCPVLASVAQWPEIQPLVSRGQIVSGVLPLLTDRQTDTQTDNYNFSIMMVHLIIFTIMEVLTRVLGRHGSMVRAWGTSISYMYMQAILRDLPGWTT